MAITLTHKSETPFWKDVSFLEKCKKTDFVALIYEMLSEKIPSDKQRRLFELILKLSIDHGQDTPSAIPVIDGAKAGENVSASIARGIKKIDDSHGGAGENAMTLFYKLKRGNLNVEETIKAYLQKKIRIPGFGHRLYKKDVRAEMILEEVDALDIGREYAALALFVEETLRKHTSKNLPINIDGALAAALCALDWKAETAKPVFIIARIPGLLAHFLNNKKIF